VSPTWSEVDESIERELFERRARLPGGRVGVPSLDAVLLAARSEARESSSGRRRAWGGLALAAACLFAVVKTRSGDGAPTIVADVAGEGTFTAYRGGGQCEVQEAPACSFEPSVAVQSIEPPAPRDERVSAGPKASFASSDALCCKVDEPGRSDLR